MNGAFEAVIPEFAWSDAKSDYPESIPEQFPSHGMESGSQSLSVPWRDDG